MSSAHSYRPRFVDIRIRPPSEDEATEIARCDWTDCVAPAECRAPKGPDRLRDYYWFCPRHASEYNKSWNFFAEMSDDEIREYQAASATGHRPTWSMKTNNTARARGANGWSKAHAHAAAEGFTDPFDIFGPEAEARVERPRASELGRLEANAYRDLGFEGRVSVDEVRARYTELVKRFHPDANGGDRTSEGRLQQVIHAYKTLKRAGMA